MIINGFLFILAAITAVGVFVAESIDRPRRRTERLAKQETRSFDKDVSRMNARGK